ncbi:MAG: VPS9 domain-containing protein [archaeon]|nr:VPS9 domain-containing protein [archaeon]
MGIPQSNEEESENIQNKENNEEENESEEYFDLINQKVTNENKNQQREQTLGIDTNKPKKNWKATILKFLDKQNAIGITWCKTLRDLIAKENFTSEQKFIDLFFWQKFSLKTKPKCLSNINSENNDLNNSSSSPNYNTNDNSSSGRVSRISSSDISMSEYQMSKEKVIQYIKIFQSHLQSSDHPISICIQLFWDVFCKEIKFHLDEVKEYQNEEEKIERAQLVAEAITQQLVFFLFKLQKCFGLMYSSALSYKYFENEKEEFTNMFTTEFFKNDDLYDLIMELFTLSNKREIESLNLKIETLNKLNIQTEDIGINPKYCLNSITEKAQIDFIKEKNIEVSEDQLSFLKSYYKKEDYIPYYTAIELLNQLDDYQTPYEKINLLHSMGSEVIDNVLAAWKPIEDDLPHNYLSIDGDELILILSYIVIKAQMSDLLAHLYFIKMFTTGDTKSSMIGYYYTTIEASIITVRELDENKILELREKNKKPFESIPNIISESKDSFNDLDVDNEDKSTEIRNSKDNKNEEDKEGEALTKENSNKEKSDDLS